MTFLRIPGTRVAEFEISFQFFDDPDDIYDAPPCQSPDATRLR